MKSKKENELEYLIKIKKRLNKSNKALQPLDNLEF